MSVAREIPPVTYLQRWLLSFTQNCHFFHVDVWKMGVKVKERCFFGLCVEVKVKRVGLALDKVKLSRQVHFDNRKGRPPTKLSNKGGPTFIPMLEMHHEVK